MNYGTFDDQNYEYIITNPKTPVKWINYIGTLDFGGFIDQTGGALLCKGDPSLNRITNYSTQRPAGEFRATTLYLREHTSSGYRLLAPFFVPCLSAYERYECHVGLGYSKFVSEIQGIRCEATIFVPIDQPVEIRSIEISNLRSEPVDLDIISVVEYSHFDAVKQLTNADWVPQTMQSWLADDENGVKTLAQAAFMQRGRAVNFFTSNLPATSFETDRRAFLGDQEYGTWADPVGLHQAELSNSQAVRGDNIAAMLHPLGTLEPQEAKSLITLLGQFKDIQEARPIFNKLRKTDAVELAFKDLKAFWQEKLETLQVETPNADLNTMLNIHNPRQCMTTKNWSRYLSLYQLGYGSRGIGFRDSSQDVMGVTSLLPEESKNLLRRLLSVQKQNGSAMHQFNPLNMEGSAGDSNEREDRPHYYCDDHLWVVLAVCAYIKETGNIEFLKEVLPFYEKDRNGNALENAPVLDHLLRAVEFTHTDLGVHGLPLLGFADWNDTINLATGAESALAANLYGRALLELADLLDFISDDRSDRLRTDYQTMRSSFENSAWDGSWYRSYFDADGEPLGSQKNEAGKIYNYGQSWPVFSGFASNNRAQQAMESMHNLLNTSCGIKTSAPGFTYFDPKKGGVTTYPPGAKENGGVFLHTNPWAIIACCLLGKGDLAFQYYEQTNPAAQNDRIDTYECEPYVYAQNILGDEHPLFGLARNSWLSGTASWMYQAGTQYMLGIRPEYQGLRLDPCIPKNWNGFKAQRQFRGSHYDIEVRNPQHVNRGPVSVQVDGQEIQGNLIPIFNDQKSHKIILTLGIPVKSEI